MKIIRALLPIALMSIPALAQAPASSPAPSTGSSDAPQMEDTTFRTHVTQIVAPTIVTDRSGNLIDGIQPAQFHLFDNGKEQNIQVDVTFQPLSIVVAVEVSSRVEGVMNQIKHLGSLLPLVVGDHGEASILAFDSRLRVMQDFTTDPDKLKAAVDHLTVGNSSSRMIDAVDKGVFMLRHRPEHNRKIILLVSETRDMASEGRLRESLIDAQMSNTLIYCVNINELVSKLTEKRTEPRPDPIDITSRPTVMGQPNTPTTEAQNYGVQNQVQFAPLLKEIYTQAKRLFVDNPSEVLTKGTGGTELSFMRQRGLEDAMQRISTELRSQYLISYSPSNKDEPGFHDISVVVERSTYITKTRPGYWIGGGAQ